MTFISFSLQGDITFNLKVLVIYTISKSFIDSLSFIYIIFSETKKLSLCYKLNFSILIFRVCDKDSSLEYLNPNSIKITNITAFYVSNQLEKVEKVFYSFKPTTMINLFSYIKIIEITYHIAIKTTKIQLDLTKPVE